MAASATTAAARFLHSTTSVLLRNPPSFVSFSHLPSPRLPRCIRFSTVPEAAPAVLDAAWPEWEELLEKLRGRGYLERIAATDKEGEVGDEYGKVKAACLLFARERPDILRYLSRNDIQAVVQCGCPNILRKSVNSAKRLREFVNLDEGRVCGTCNLRGSCDRAYILPMKDGGAQTVDIMRVLLHYAMHILPDTSGCSQLEDSVKESGRRLLCELVNLCDTEPDPEVLESLAKQSLQIPKVKPNRQLRNAEMKMGDWICSKCNFMNYARNFCCRECKADRPMSEFPGKPEMKKGDWSCTKCQFMNFARNRECKRCQSSRPQASLEPGEWECPSCGFVNFSKNDICRKCNFDRPEDQSNLFKPHIWRRPNLDTKAFMFSGLSQNVSSEER